MSCGSPYESMIEEIEHTPTLTEVVFPSMSDPGDFLEQIVGRFGSRVGMAALALDPTYIYPRARQVVAEHALEDHHDVVVLVVDSSATAMFSSAFLAGSDDELRVSPWRPGPFSAPKPGFEDNDGTSHWWRAMAGVLADFAEAARADVERTGARVILVTQDARPVRGRGTMTSWQTSRDTRVRSIIGNAGRRSCHQRYYVDTGRDGNVCQVVLWKDELEGLVGRFVYLSPRSEPEFRRRHPRNQGVARATVDLESRDQ
jgi:hypothetical protein